MSVGSCGQVCMTSPHVLRISDVLLLTLVFIVSGLH